MEELLRILIILIVVGLTLPPLFTILTYLTPNRVQRIQGIIEQRPRRAFVVGLINALFFGLIMAIFANEGEGGGFIALMVLLFLLALAFLGFTAFMLTLRQRMFGTDALTDTVKTAVLFTAALSAPFVGWFVLAPILAIFSIGATIMSLFGRRGKKIGIGDQGSGG